MKALFGTVFPLFVCFSLSAQEPAVDTVNQRLLFTDGAETEKWLLREHIPALGIAYIEDGKITEAVVYGRNEKGEPYSTRTLFNVASLTKPVTSLVALKLIHAGKWKLDEPLAGYWTDPDVAEDPRSRQLTTRHVLSHQSGFPNWRPAGGKLAFEFDPGTGIQYSGEGFEYLRKALEKKFGKTLDQLAQELIFGPLGMKRTHFYWNKRVKEEHYAQAYRADGTRYELRKRRSANAADDLLTTVNDYARLLLHVIDGAGLNKALYGEMTAVQAQIKPRKHWGLGWWVDENVEGEEDALLHGGDDKGVHTIVFILPESKKGLLIFTNSDNGTAAYLPAVQHYLGKAGQAIIDIETK